MQVAHPFLSATSLLLLLGLSACGESPKEPGSAPGGSKSALEQAASKAAESAPVKAGMGEYNSPGASADTIMKASREGNAEMVKLLIGEKADVNFALPDGLCSLHVAAAEGHIEVVRVLLENKANPNLRQAAGATPLIAALQAKRLDIIQLLLQNGADPNIAMRNGSFPLIMFDQFKWSPDQQPKLAELLLQAGANLNQRIEAKGNTALMAYSADGNLPMMKWLVEHKVKTNLKGDQGYTALGYATVANQLPAAKLLIDAGVDLSIANNNGDKPLRMAQRSKLAEMEALLAKAEADRAKGK